MTIIMHGDLLQINALIQVYSLDARAWDVVSEFHTTDRLSVSYHKS